MAKGNGQISIQVTCQLCGKNGHVASDCRSKNSNGNNNRNQGKHNQNSTGNKSCRFCQRNGHIANECFNNPNGNNYKGTRQSSMPNTSPSNGNTNSSPKHCTFCNKQGHTADECFKNPNSNNYKGKSKAQPSNNDLPEGARPWSANIPFDLNCNICGGSNHYSHLCPRLNQHRGQFMPMIYPPPGAFAQGQIHHFTPQSYTHQPFQEPTRVREEFFTPPPVQTQLQFFSPAGYRGPTRLADYKSRECERQVYMDREGDVIMQAVEVCYACYPQTPRPDEFTVNFGVWGSHHREWKQWDPNQGLTQLQMEALQHQSQNQSEYDAMVM